MKPDSNSYYLVYCTCPNEETAQSLSTRLIEAGLAACVTILPAVQSIYRWEGKVTSSAEHLLMIKTTQNYYSAIEAAILQQHPYEVPEIIAVPIVAGSEKYLRWIQENCDGE